ncbi:MAG TPA: orotidine-5'-phosphate decarboxylase, partial [Ignavibacteriaceae bacterium]|nr:orotidine-5'-phosphate decarboxylase [Ignavibacteriaceae bacterium]
NNEGKFICVGLDTDIKKIPQKIKSSPDSIFKFNKEIIERTVDSAAAYKINFAFYEKYGPEGYELLKRTIDIIPDDLITIGDAKRGDIGNTSTMYADSIFNFFSCDATTINPYMGEDSVKPFLEFKDRIIFILALTSNPGANNFEKVKLENGNYLYQEVISKIKEWNSFNNCGVVFGATQIEELKNNLTLINNLPVLLPGVGAQGGSLEEVVQCFKQANRINFLINISRGIIYKSSGDDFGAMAAEELNTLNTKVKKEMKM